MSLGLVHNEVELQSWLREVLVKHPGAWFSLEPWIEGRGVVCTYLDHRLSGCIATDNNEDLTGLIRGAIPLVLPKQYPARFVSMGQLWQRSDGLRYTPWDCEGLTEEHLSKVHRSARWKTHHIDFMHITAAHAQPLSRTVPGADLVVSLALHVAQVRRERDSLWKGLGMPTKGIMVKVDTQEHREQIDQWACGFSLMEQATRTLLTGVEWRIDRHGYLIPWGILESTMLAGVPVDRALLEDLNMDLPCLVGLRSEAGLPIAFV
jgi:hypothetical protein